MKKFIILALLALAVLSVQAQTYNYQALSLPATLAAGTTNLANQQTIGSLKQQNVALSATLTATATTTNIYTFQRSVDGINYDTNTPTYFVAWTTGSSNTITTNVPVQGFGYLKLVSVQTFGGTVTNNAHSYGIKLVAP